MKKFGRIALRTLLWIIASITGLVLLLIVIIRIPAVQNYVVGQVTNFLENKIGTPVDIGYVSLDFPKKLVLEGVYFEDQAGDTLIAGDRLMVDISMLKLLRNTVEISEIHLAGITAKINRTLPDSTFNFDYIVAAFASPQQQQDPDTATAMMFDIDKVELDRIRFVYNDEVIGMAADINLGHLDTRIKTFDLSDNMRFALPAITIDGLNASIRQWATADPGDAPSADDFGLEPEPEAASLLPDLEFGDFDLRNIVFTYADDASAMDTRFQVTRLQAKLNELELNGEFVDVESVLLDGSTSRVFFGQTAAASTESTADTAASEPVNWRVVAKEVIIKNTDFAYEDANQPKLQYGFDYANIGITALEGELLDLFYSADSIGGDLRHLSARDRSGFQLDELRARFAYTDQGAALTDLYAETPHTLLREHIQVGYPSLSTITDQLGQISIDANLRDSHLGMADVTLFVPELDTMQAMQSLLDAVFHVDGRVAGRLDNLRIPQLEVTTLDDTRLSAQANIRGLPDIDRMRVDLDLEEFRTSRRDVERLIPAGMLPDSMRVPDKIRLVGTFNGGINAFDTDMQLVTTEGSASVDATYQAGPRGQDTLYNANLSIMDIDVGKILGDTTLGRISIAAQAKGAGFNPKTAVADIQAKLLLAQYRGYDYQDIDFTLQAEQGDIEIFANSDDSNLDLTLDGTADFNGIYPSAKLNLTIDSINLQNLNFMADNFRYQGRIVADFETADIDHLNGALHILNSSVAYNAERYALDSVSIIAEAGDERTLLLLQSEFLRAHMVGNYELSQLSAAIQDVVAVYYQPDSIATVYEYEAQQMDFSMTFTRSRFIRGLLPALTEMEDVTLDGSFTSDDKLLFVKLMAPEVVYGGTELRGINMDINTVDSTMYYSLLVEQLAMGQTELINTLLSGTVVQNLMEMGLWIKDQQDKERYHLGMVMRVDANNFIFALKEDGLMLNYDEWDVASDNALRFGTAGVSAHNFLLSNNGQEMRIESQDSIPNSPIDLTFDNFRIETLSEILESESLRLGGGINGQATVSRLDASPVFVSDLVIADFFFGNDTVGDISLQVNNERENTFTANVGIEGNGNNVSLTGDFITVPGRESTLDFDLNLSPLTMNTLEAFSLGYLRNTSGDIGGRLKITGTVDQPRLNGELLFNQASLNVAMLNATFNIDQQRITFNNSGFRFSRFEFKDSQGNVARLNGTVATTTYTDFDFGISLTANDFQVLNATAADNDLYYGKLFVTSNLSVRGNMDSPVVEGTITVNDETDVTFVLPNDDPGLVEREGIVRFVDKSDTTFYNAFGQLDSLTRTELGGLDVSVDIRTESEADFTVVIDPGTQDALHIRGEAMLNAAIEPSGRINMTGTYTVEDGSYSFSFGPVNRDFQFKQGSTIVWAGDPLDARLDITAVYRLRAPTLELVQSQVGGQNQNIYRQRVPFDVNLRITEDMFSPNLGFDITLDANNAMVSQDVVQQVNGALAQLREQESDMNKQVFALIILGRFIAPNPFESLSGGGGVESIARNTVSSLLSEQLNRLAGDLIQGVELEFDLQSTEDYTTGAMQNRTDLNVGISKMLFDDRLKVTVGSNFEIEGKQRPGERATNIAGDISLDYQLSRDGRYILRAYRKNQYQVTLMGQFVETGLGFIINMDYDEFKEVFMSANQLQAYYNTDSRRFRRRFDVERMQVDSVYRDSVRRVILDSIRKNNPELLDSMRLRGIQPADSLQSEQPQPARDTTHPDTLSRRQEPIRNEQEMVGIQAERRRDEEIE